jgi:hypothetical protein
MKKKPAVKRKAKEKTGRHPYEAADLAVKVLKAPRGLLDDQLSAHIGIGRTKFYELRNESSDFADAVSFYRDQKLIHVLNAFEKVAVGFSYDEETKELKKNKETGKYEMVTTKVVTKHVAPSESAAFKYLKNKLPEQFKDKIENVITAGDQIENITLVIKGRNNE